MYRVAILMSTYNGERYLKEQIDSILNQEDVEINLYIRDDGSGDHTVEIIHKYLKKYANIFFTQGVNIGVGNSFMQLVYDVASDFDYYAFADQDDIWLPQKLSKAIEKIEEFKGFTLYCSNQILVNKYGKRMGLRYINPIDSSYLQILCNNRLPGCTMVWNRQLQKLLMEIKRHPSEILLQKRIHDVWVSMVASVTGSLYYDEDAYILYRQHENNVVGIKKGSVYKEWEKKIKNKELRNGKSSLAEEILSKFGDVIKSEKIYNKLRKCAYYKQSISEKFSLYRDTEIMNHSNENKVILGIKIMLNLF